MVGPRGSRLELQLDGCGPTPCAPAGADGRRSLRSALYELLASEALHALGVPTVRAGVALFHGIAACLQCKHAVQTVIENHLESRLTGAPHSH